MEILDNGDYKNPKEHKTADPFRRAVYRTGFYGCRIGFATALYRMDFLSCKTHLTFLANDTCRSWCISANPETNNTRLGNLAY